MLTSDLNALLDQQALQRQDSECSRRHEIRKTRIGDLLEIYFLEADIDYFPFGSTTLRHVVTSGGLNKLEVYRRLNVKEVWFWQNERFSLYYLREEIPVQFVQTCGYEQIYRSEILPNLDIELLAEYVRYPNSLAAVKEFRQRLISG
ncbi:MAG: hypothetical protein EAZ18_19625 [Oscillatoriales cyanobacterium]|nr:MAG: hypothetical protein EAZ18_19625 [Oscillatoriales cyanobacterium]